MMPLEYAGIINKGKNNLEYGQDLRNFQGNVADWMRIFILKNAFVASEAECQQGHGNCPGRQAYSTANERKFNLFNCQVITLPIPSAQLTLGHPVQPSSCPAAGLHIWAPSFRREADLFCSWALTGEISR